MLELFALTLTSRLTRARVGGTRDTRHATRNSAKSSPTVASFPIILHYNHHHHHYHHLAIPLQTVSLNSYQPLSLYPAAPLKPIRPFLLSPSFRLFSQGPTVGAFHFGSLTGSTNAPCLALLLPLLKALSTHSGLNVSRLSPFRCYCLADLFSFLLFLALIISTLSFAYYASLS